jgi:PDZ domain-containing protein
VAIFADHEPTTRRAPRGGGWFGWSLILVAIIAITTIALVPSPYVIETPGPVFDVLSSVESDGDDVPLIEIPVEETYPTTGSLNMLTVSIHGNRESPVNWFDVALAWLDPSKAVVPLESVYPAGVTVEQSNEENAAQMTSSQQEAIAAALINLGYDVPTSVTIGQVGDDTPAFGKLEAGDVVTEVGGKAVADETALRAAIVDNGTDKALKITVQRAGKPVTVSVTPVLSTADTPTPIIGVVLGATYTFPFDISIQIENVGGPSAGQMFALGIIDKLTPGALTGGADVAGTGTITEDGTIGPIGGIRQKLYGASEAGAKYFLAPADNCDEVVDHVPDGLTVFSVSDLSDSLEVLSAISSKSDTSKLATCEAN